VISIESATRQRAIRSARACSWWSAVRYWLTRSSPPSSARRFTPVHNGLSTQVAVGIDEGLKQDSSIHCDELVSLPKSSLTDYIGSLPHQRITQLNRALRIALAV
jgi:hypothetical protein